MSARRNNAGHDPTRPKPAGPLVGILAAVVIAGGVAAIVYAIWASAQEKPAPRFANDPSGEPIGDDAPVVCRELRSFPTGFDRSRCVAMAPDGTVGVSGDFAVRRFDPNGRQVGQFDVIEPPGPLAFDANGTAYVGTGGKVMVFGPDGERRAVWPSPGAKAFLTSIEAADSGVYVADAGNRVVLRYDREGKLLNSIGRKDAVRHVPGFFIPSPYFDLAMAPDGLLRVVSPGRHRIEAYTTAGDLEGSWGRFGMDAGGFSGCCNPANFALLHGRGGRLGGFVTAEKGRSRVKMHAADGEVIGLLAPSAAWEAHDRVVANNPAGEPFSAFDLAVTPAGEILLLDPVRNVVRVFVRTGGAATKETE